MKFCPICQTQYPEDANFCPLESCATPAGPQRLEVVAVRPAARFTPSERIGGGRTGEVWRAHDAQTGAEVAYKIIDPQVVATPASLARAERELKQLMRVTSPKIAAILACEKTSTTSGGLAVAMELCPGDSLERMLAAGPVPFEKARSIVAQVGLALLEAQKVGLVHRDVAPKNVLVSASGDVKVINFPLAQPLGERVAGVPAYLSPEQAQGKPVDQRSNTYSLAAVLYHLLTGEPPFVGASAQAVLEMQVSSPVLPPTQRRPGAGLPPEVDKLILKAMEKSSSRRHLTLRLFLNELEAIRERPPAAAKSVGEAGPAKTMMLGGSQADITRMVAEAKARAAAARAAVPAAQNPASSPSSSYLPPSPAPPSPALATVHGIAPSRLPGMTAKPIALSGQASDARMMPSSGVLSGQPLAARLATPSDGVTGSVKAPSPQPALHGPTPAPYVITPPPVEKTPPATAARPAAAATVSDAQPARSVSPPRGTEGKGQGAAFRETLWFKQGDVEQMVAAAKAKMKAAGQPVATEAAPEAAVDARPLEERYADDGSVTVEDRKKFSLRSGTGGVAVPAAAAGHVPGEKIDEKEMVGEISGGRRTLILIIATVLILALAIVLFMMVKSKGKGAIGRDDQAGSAMMAASPGPGGAGPGGPLPDADAASGAPPGQGAADATAGRALGNTGGAAKPVIGGATGEAKKAKKVSHPAPPKKKLAAKHPLPKGRQHQTRE